MDLLQTVRERKAQLIMAREKHWAAYDGAIQECDYWIDFLTPQVVGVVEPTNEPKE
jgi:hypothetical protein